jgi:hypothetical protein
VKIFSAADGKMICKMKKHTDWVTALCFTPDGKSLISGDRAGGLSVWDCQGHELQAVSAHTAGITGIACRGSYVATSSEDGTVKFWDIVEGKELKSWHAHEGGVRSVAFTADGHIVTSGRDRLVRLWDMNGNQVRQFEPLNDIAMQAACAGGKIIAADWTGGVRVWKQDGTKVGNLESNPPTIAQRIDALNKRIADLEAVALKEQDARGRAGALLAAAQKSAESGAAALEARKAGLVAAQGRLAGAQKEAADAGTAVQKAREEVARLGGLVGEMAWAGAVNPLLEPEVSSALGLHGMAEHSLILQNTELDQAKISVACRRNECAACAGEIQKSAVAYAGLEKMVKAPADAVAAAGAALDKTGVEIKYARLGLVRWQAAEARLTSDPEYALWKRVGK